LVYSTYLGGAGFDSADGGIVVDASGNAYVAGYTQSANFPTTAGVVQTAFNGSEDAFVAKLNPTGSSLIYATYLGGSSGAAVGFAIAVDSAGNVYLAGATNATNFPTTTGAFQTAYSGSSGSDGFVAKLNATGSTLIYSTYLGGTGSENQPTGIAINGSGNAYVMGQTFSSDFPTTAGAFQS